MTPPKTGTELRREALKMVEQCICNDRQKTHGDAEDNFANIATIANIVLKNKLAQPLDALDVALFSMCIKMGRCATSPRHLDNLIDHAGYAMCGAGIVLRETENSTIASEEDVARGLWKGLSKEDYEKMYTKDVQGVVADIFKSGRDRIRKLEKNARRREKRRKDKVTHPVLGEIQLTPANLKLQP